MEKLRLFMSYARVSHTMGAVSRGPNSRTFAPPAFTFPITQSSFRALEGGSATGTSMGWLSNLPMWRLILANWCGLGRSLVMWCGVGAVGEPRGPLAYR